MQLLTHYPNAHVFVHTSPHRAKGHAKGSAWSDPPWAGQGDFEAAVRDIQTMYSEIIGPAHLRHVNITNLNPGP